MKNYIVFDNGGITVDRFTIINLETADVFGASERPCEPDGIGKWIGNLTDHRTILYGGGWRQRLPPKKVIQTEVDNYVNNAKLDPGWLGTEVAGVDLPERVRQYIEELNVDDP